MTEDAIKERLIAIIKDNFGDHGVKEDVADLEDFGLYLSQNMVYNIITTNYDDAIEFILREKCGYKETGVAPNRETTYSIRRYKTFLVWS